MPGRPPSWIPPTGSLVTFSGRSQRGLSRNVRVIAEASGGRMIVEAIGRQGVPVRLTVKQENLSPMQPSLFDPLPSGPVAPPGP